MAADCTDSPHCSLDDQGCLKLSCILRAFNAAISEEQAWAVCFQSAKCMVNEWNSDSSACFCLSDTAHVFIHKDGSVHKSTVRLPLIDGIHRQLAPTQHALVANLGSIIFSALDFGMCKNEERKLSPPLECLIDRLTSANMSSSGPDCERFDSSSEDDDCPDNDSRDDYSLNADEGIVEDEKITIYSDEHGGKHKNGLTLVKVMEMCASHLSCPGQADCHYKAVCRALVAEVLELSSFLENVSNKAKAMFNSDPDGTDTRTLQKLKIHDWARLWMQVIQQLRQGVKLKKVDPAHIAHPIEYELTPYEMLLDDIRSRRYKLKQVMVNGDIPPRVKKDAHALILEFIRSRPPLVPVSRRKLPPTPPRQLTLYEKLMQSIRQQHKLKPTNEQVETSRTKLQDEDITPQPHRRLIKADLTLRLSSSFEEDDVDDILPTPAEQPKSMPVRNGKGSLIRSNSHIGNSTVDSDRRHSISVCESPPKVNGTSARSSRSLDRSARSDYWKSSQWQSLECLSLTLEEVVHIRNVLTKAELESLVVDPALYDDLLKGKVCFTCKRTRFAFFGAWSTKCKMCERAVCDKCSSKMCIPTEHFARIPVYMLSPTPSPPPEEELSHSPWKISDVFTFASPSVSEHRTPKKKLQRQATITTPVSSNNTKVFRHSESLHIMPRSKAAHGSQSVPRMKRPLLQRAKTIQGDVAPLRNDDYPEKMTGPLVPVCRDCKVMVRNIIQASNDKRQLDRERKLNYKTWPHKKSLPSPIAATMTPVIETPSSSPEEVFHKNSTPDIRQHVTAAAV